MSIKLGFPGLGGAGHSIAKGLKTAGLADITAFDIKLDKPETAPLIRSRAEDAGVSLVRGPAGVAAGSDIVIAAVTSADSLVAARSIAAHLGRQHIYVDINSTSPATKQEGIVEAKGAAMSTLPSWMWCRAIRTRLGGDCPPHPLGPEQGLPQKFVGRIPERYQEVISVLSGAAGAKS